MPDFEATVGRPSRGLRRPDRVESAETLRGRLPLLFRFDDYELDEDRYELRRCSETPGEAGEPIEVQPKVMEVLLQLLRGADRTLSKDELLEAVWSDVEITEGSLTRCISLARRAFGENEKDARIIQTVRGRGYRIGVDVDAVEPTLPLEPLPREERTDIPRVRRRAPQIVFGALALLLIGFLWLARPFHPAIVAPLPEPPSAHPASAVAVLPFSDLRDPSSRSLAIDGLALELIDQLSRWPELQVTSFRSSFRFSPSEPIDPVAAGKSLGVGTLVMGSLRQQDASTIRLQVELVDTENGFQLWTESFSMTPDELFDRKERITQRVGEALGLSVAGTEPLRHVIAHPEARRLLLSGRRAVFEADREALLETVAIYERALELSPDLISAYVALSETYHRLWEVDGQLGKEGLVWLPAAEALALEALERAPDDPDALTIYATVRVAERKWDEAEAALTLALERHAGATASNRLGTLLMIRGRVEEARPHVERALRLDPLDPAVVRNIGRFHLYSNEPLKAISFFERVLELQPSDLWAPRLLANAYDMAGEHEAAREAIGRILPGFVRPLARIHGRLFGSDRTIRNLLALDRMASGRKCRRDAHGTALMWAYLRERDQMIECLAIASSAHLWYSISEPLFKPYHADPEFRSIIEAAGFAPTAGWQNEPRASDRSLEKARSPAP